MKNTMKMCVWILGGMGFVCATQATVISNAGFEADTFGTWPGYSSGALNGPITGWTASDSGRIGLNPADSSHPSPNPFANNGVVPQGSQVAFIQSGAGTTPTLSSTSGITGLIAGRTYNLTFRVNARAGNLPNMGVNLGGVEVVRNVVTSVGGANPYKYVSHNFVATGSSMSLAINNTADGDNSLLVDDFVVTEVTPKLTLSAWTGDVSSGIDPTRSYTHAFNLGTGAQATSVNGVAFTAVPGANPAVGGSFSYNIPNQTADVANNLNTGGSALLADSFVFGGADASLILEGLTDGTTYRTTLFTVGWDATPGRNTTFSVGNERLTADGSGFGNNNGARVDIEFTASGTTQEIGLQSLGGATWHTYAFANSVVVPEPSAMALVLLGGLALMRHRRSRVGLRA